MKNNYLKVLCTLVMSIAICSVKAQSLQQKTQKDMDLRKRQVNEVLLKANGSVKVGKAGIFVTKPFTYNRKHRIEDLSFPR